MSTNRLVKITVINDFVRPSLFRAVIRSVLMQICPNCYIGHHELLSAISYTKAVLQLPLSFEIEFRPYRLVPHHILNEDTPKATRTEFFQKHLGKEAFEGFKDNSILKWADERRLKMCVFSPSIHRVQCLLGTSSFNGIMSSTTRAHRMSRKAYLLGKQNLQLPFICATFKAYLELSQDISDINVLATLAEAVKIMSKQEVRPRPLPSPPLTQRSVIGH